jgi:hypothetical protein
MMERRKTDMSEGDARRCCGGLDPEFERELLSLIRDGTRPLEIIKRLREATGAPFEDCKRWVAEHAAGPTAPCPYCQAPLATSRAEQCFKCGRDWHDPNNVFRHG